MLSGADQQREPDVWAKEGGCKGKVILREHPVGNTKQNLCGSQRHSSGRRPGNLSHNSIGKSWPGVDYVYDVPVILC